MKNLSTIKYLDQILDTTYSSVRLNAKRKGTMLTFNLNNVTAQMFKNILVDNGVKVCDVVDVEYNVNRAKLEIGYSFGGKTESKVYDFPFGHSPTSANSAFNRMIDLSKH